MNVKELTSRSITGAIREVLSRAAPRPHTPSETVKRRKLPYWQERGWVRDGVHYRGTYQTDYGCFIGHIQQKSSKEYDVYIFEPPMQELAKHPHFTCFQARNQGWWHVHLSRQPADASSAIMAVEKTLTEAFER